MSPPPATTPRSRPRRLRLVAPGVLGIAICAIALSGCVAFQQVGFSQSGSIGSINVTLQGCGSKANTPDCGLSITNLESNSTASGQVLLGLRVDARFALPESFTTVLGQPFTVSPSYTAELTRVSPPDSGFKWVGYISDSRTYTPGAKDLATIPIVPPLPDGSPFPRPFIALFVLGSRGVVQDFPATRPVTCGVTITQPADLTICEDTGFGISRGDIRNFAFLTPTPVTVQPGQTAIIPVTGKFAGLAAPAINFALTATTTLAGTSALPSVPTLAPPTDSTTSVSVSVPVPLSAAPGAYSVTLTGTLGTGESRSATGTLIVAGPTAGPGGRTTSGTPSLSTLKVSPKTISSARGSAPSLISVTLSDPGRLTVLLERQVAGRKRRGRCVAATSALKRAGAVRCTRFITVSSLTKAGLGAGVAKVSISGRVGRHPRASGTYRLTLTSLSATGIASLPLRTTLTITR